MSDNAFFIAILAIFMGSALLTILMQELPAIIREWRKK